MVMAKTSEQLQSYADVYGHTVDYSYWEDDATARARAKADFKNAKTYAPDFRFPKINNPLVYPILDYNLDPASASYAEDGTPIYDSLLAAKKSLVVESVYELEANRTMGVWSEARCAFYADFQEAQLKKILLIESAGRLNDISLTSQEHITARQEFMALNEEVFGEYDIETFSGMMNTEISRLHDFAPSDQASAEVKSYLLSTIHTDKFPEPEKDLIEQELLDDIKAAVSQRYADTLGAVPDSDDSVIYNAEQCKEIMNNALMATDLYDNGWRVEVNPKKSAPATNAVLKRIYLPSATQRTADEIKRLIVHEQEVHARRGHNGDESGEEPLARGTAAYADVEEGLGVILECALAGSVDNPAYHRARDRYIVAGLALGADGQPRDARQTYEIVWRMLAVRMTQNGIITEEISEKAKAQAITHIENAFRATNGTMPGVIYTKLKVYYEGLAKNVAYFKKYDGTINEALDAAMVGKCDHTDESEMANISKLIQERAA